MRYPVVNLSGSAHLGSPGLGQYEYETENLLEKTQKAYNDAVKTRDPGKIEDTFDDYKKAYDEYAQETPLREQLENLDRDAATAGRDGDMARYQDIAAKMEELWPGWYKAHLDWKVYERTGGQPEWYVTLKEKTASAVEVGLQILPMLPAGKGVRVPRFRPPVATPSGARPAMPVVLPPVPTPPVTPPKTMPVATPGGASTAQPPRYPVVNLPPPSPVLQPVATPSLAPGKPPSGGGARPSVPTPGGKGSGGAPVPPPGDLPDHLKPLPTPANLSKYPPEVRKAYMDLERYFIETGISKYDETVEMLKREGADLDQLRQLMQDLGYKGAGPAPLPLEPGEKVPIRPSPMGPRPVYPVPLDPKFPFQPVQEGPPRPKVPTPGGGYKWIETPQSKAPTMPITPPTATGMTPTPGGGSEAPCPPGQFRPARGAPCRESVGAMPGIPGGLPGGGGGMPVATSYLSGGRIVRGGFGQSIWT